MDYANVIVELYNSVNENQKRKFTVRNHLVRQAFQDMKEAYMPNRYWESEFSNKIADYDDPAYRYAYLHKYAMLHTGLLCNILQSAFYVNHIYHYIEPKRKLNICSLGGGPGTDIVALLLVVKEVFGFMQCNVSVIDFCQEWKHVFDAIVSELGRKGCARDMVNRNYFSYEYLSADLLNMSYWSQYKVHSALTNADIITMIKFVSAAACEKTRQMIAKIFQLMKPGGLLIFVDNAAGGFREMIYQAASGNGMQSVFGPLEHYEYEEPRFSQTLLGYTSQSKTKVTVQIWKKPHSFNTTQELRAEYIQSYRPERANVRLNSRAGTRDRESSQNDCCSII